MEDFQIILYIIFGVIYFLSRFLKKKPQDQAKRRPRPQQDQDQEQPTTEQPMTFEDLLREFTGEQTQESEVETERPLIKPKPPKQDYDFEGDYPTDDEIQKVYEESIRDAQKDRDVKPTEEPRMRFKEFYIDEDADENELASEFADMLKNPESAQKAIILKELLDRKY